MIQGSLTAFGMTLLVEFAQCADPETGVIAGGVTPALERSEGSFASFGATLLLECVPCADPETGVIPNEVRDLLLP
jgi:hypothetical protein